MKLDPLTYRRFCRLAAWTFIVAAVALWFPFSWHPDPSLPGTRFDVEFGVLEPLRLTWRSSDAGFWLGFSEVRTGAFLLSVVLTASAVLSAREMAHRSRRGPSTLVPS